MLPAQGVPVDRGEGRRAPVRAPCLPIFPHLKGDCRPTPGARLAGCRESRYRLALPQKSGGSPASEGSRRLREPTAAGTCAHGVSFETVLLPWFATHIEPPASARPRG